MLCSSLRRAALNERREPVRDKGWRGIKTAWKELDVRVKWGNGSAEKHCNPLREGGVIWQVGRNKQMSTFCQDEVSPLCCSETLIQRGGMKKRREGRLQCRCVVGGGRSGKVRRKGGWEIGNSCLQEEEKVGDWSQRK